MVRHPFIFGLCLTTLFTACGKKDSDSDTSPFSGDSSIVEDEALSQESFEGSMSDALATLSDSNETSESATLALANHETNRDTIKDRSCEKKEDGSVVVLAERSIDRTFEIERPRLTATHTIKGSHSMERIWTADFAIDCTEGDTVNVDWKSDVAGLKLVANVSRSLENEHTLTHTSGRSVERSVTIKAEGQREIEWLASEEADGLITRDKVVKSSMTRSVKTDNSKGVEKDLNFTVETKEDAPFEIQVVRNASTLALQSKTIASGTLVATRANDGRVESTFENLKMTFADGACQLATGKVTASFFKEGSDSADKSYELTIVDGVATLKDVNSGEEIEDFDLPGCSLSDFEF